MTLSVAQGEEINLPAEFFSGEDPADPASTLVSIVNPSGDRVVEDKPPERISVGVYRFSYRVPKDAPPGTWKANWTAVIDGTEAVGEDLFEVLPAGEATAPLVTDKDKHPAKTARSKRKTPMKTRKLAAPATAAAAATKKPDRTRDPGARTSIIDPDSHETKTDPGEAKTSTTKTSGTKSVNTRRKQYAVAALVVALIGILLFNRFREREALPPAQALQEGLAAHKAGDLGRAQSLYADVLRGDPENKYAFFNLGTIAQQEGKLKDSISFYEMSLKSDPNFVPALFNLAIAYEEAGENNNAFDTYQKVIDLDPNNASAHLNLGFLLTRKLDRQQDGEAELRRAVELNPSLARRIPDGVIPDEEPGGP